MNNYAKGMIAGVTLAITGVVGSGFSISGAEGCLGCGLAIVMLTFFFNLLTG